MEHKSLEQLKDRAAVVELEERVAPSPRELRRMRLERLAEVLTKHGGPVTLLTRIEYLPEPDRLPLRIDNSPLEVAYRDPQLRAQGSPATGWATGSRSSTCRPRKRTICCATATTAAW